MIVAQLPDGAALGRTTAALDEATKIAQDTPGVDRVIAISGLSALDNFADLPNAGVSFVVLKPWDQRSKAKKTDIMSIAEHLQARAQCGSRRPAFCRASAADPGHRQCRRPADAARAARRQLRLSEARRASPSSSSKQADGQSPIAARPDDVQPGRAARLGDRGSGPGGDPARLGRRCVLAFCRPISDRPTSISSTSSAMTLQVYVQAEFAIPVAAGRSVEPLCAQPGQPDGADRRGRASRLGGRPVARHPLQSLSLRDRSSARPARGVSSGQAIGHDGGHRQEQRCRAMSAINGPRCPIRRS